MHFIIGTDLEINGGFSVPGLQPRHPTTTITTTAAAPSAMLGSPKHWPSPHLPPDLLVLHYLMHTNPTQTVAEFWGKVLTETYGCWWITCIIEGYENRLDSPPGWAVWLTDTVLGPLRPLLWKESSVWMSNTLIITPSSALLCGKHCVRAIFSLWDPQTGNLIIVTNKSHNCNIIWVVWRCFGTLLQWTDGLVLDRDSSLEELQY